MNIGAVVLFSYVLAITISQFIRVSITPAYSATIIRSDNTVQNIMKNSFNDYNAILDSSFFKPAGNITDMSNFSKIVSGELSQGTHGR